MLPKDCRTSAFWRTKNKFNKLLHNMHDHTISAMWFGCMKRISRRKNNWMRKSAIVGVKDVGRNNCRYSKNDVSVSIVSQLPQSSIMASIRKWLAESCFAKCSYFPCFSLEQKYECFRKIVVPVGFGELRISFSTICTTILFRPYGSDV